MWKTVVNTYKQRRRWAWGVEGFPIVMLAFLRDRRIPWERASARRTASCRPMSPGPPGPSS